MSLNKIYIDSIYTPVLKVNYAVDNTRVEQITDYDKLTLEVWTDGTISAKEAGQPFCKNPDQTAQSLC